MLTLEQLNSEYVFVQGSFDFFNGAEEFPGHGKFCDIYFKCNQGKVSQEQIDTFNSFKNNYKNYLQEFDRYIVNSLSRAEQKIADRINQAPLTFDVLEITEKPEKYDLVLVCGKTYRQFLIVNRNIDLRVEFKSGKISSIERKRNTTQENS